MYFFEELLIITTTSVVVMINIRSNRAQLGVDAPVFQQPEQQRHAKCVQDGSLSGADRQRVRAEGRPKCPVVEKDGNLRADNDRVEQDRRQRHQKHKAKRAARQLLRLRQAQRAGHQPGHDAGQQRGDGADGKIPGGNEGGQIGRHAAHDHALDGGRGKAAEHRKGLGNAELNRPVGKAGRGEGERRVDRSEDACKGDPARGKLHILSSKRKIGRTAPIFGSPKGAIQ